MKRMHVHVGVNDLARSVRFYSTLFGADPAVLKDDYAKWMLDDPRVNFAISSGQHARKGIEHLGIQVESAGELEEVYGRLKAADRPVLEEGVTTCCYAKSEKSWIADPDGWCGRPFSRMARPPSTATARRSRRWPVPSSQVLRTRRCRMSEPCNVLFLCTGNSARSILAEALLNHTGEGRFRAYSAGSQPKGEPHPVALETLRSHGFSTEGFEVQELERVCRARRAAYRPHHHRLRQRGRGELPSVAGPSDHRALGHSGPGGR